MRGEIFLNNSTLLESSAIDLKKKTKNYFSKISFLKKNKIVISYLYFSPAIKTKLVLFCMLHNNCKIQSIDKIFKSANWLEREVSEMFRINFKNKRDNRRLLLDYSKNENPLLKSFPVQGHNNLFFDFFEDQVFFKKNSTIEL